MNDLVHLAMERAAERFDHAGDLFNAAGLGCALMELADLNGTVDGHLVRVILTGRSDVEPLKGSQYRLIRGVGGSR